MYCKCGQYLKPNGYFAYKGKCIDCLLKINQERNNE